MMNERMMEMGGVRVRGFFCHRVTDAQKPRTERSFWFCVTLLFLLVGMAGNAFGADLVQGRILGVGIGAEQGRGGLYRPGSWVPVRVHLENRSGKQFVGRLGVEQTDLDGDRVMSVGPRVILQAGDVEGRDFWT